VHVAALVEVQQAARGRYQNVAVTGFEVFELLVEVHATDEGHHVKAGVFGQVGGVLGDLHHQLPGRGDDQRARFTHVALFRRRRLQQLGDDRDQERGGLASAGLGTADGVFAGKGEAQYLRLDRRAVREAQVLDGVHQFRGQFEVVETGFTFLGLDDKVFEFPWDHRRFRGAFPARLGGGRGFSLRGCLFGRCHRRRLRLRDRSGPVGLLAVIAAAGGGDRSTGDRRERLSLAFAEHLLKCFEHGDLINWLRNVRRAV